VRMWRVFGLAWLLALPAAARELSWQSLDSLGGGDRALAEQTLYAEFGDKPELWPDWIDPAALYVPVGRDRWLIVRRPVHASCGQYMFAILGTVTPALSRDKIGEFCAGDIQVVEADGRDWPDLLVREGRIPNQDGIWQRLDQRLRWKDGQWWRVLSNP
jgi:hypothetical protein